MFLVAAVLGFAAITALLALAIDAPFVVPTERVSPALGVPAAVPLGLSLLVYLGSQIAAAALRADGRGRGDVLRNTATDLFFIGIFVVVIYFHFHIKTWMPLINPNLHDDFYFLVDNKLRFVIDGAAALRAAVAAVLPAPDLWYQGAQLGLFIGSFCFHALGRRRWHHHNVTALLMNLMIGPLTYLVTPAVGPFIFEAGPNAAATAAQHEMYRKFVELQAGGPAWLAAHGGDHFSGALAAMPSLHVSAACIVSYYALKARSPFAPLMLFFAGWIVVESVVSRWHYLIDLPAGVALAAVAIAIANRVCRRRHTDAAGGGSVLVPTTAGTADRGLGAAAALRERAPEAPHPVVRPRSSPPRVWVLTCHREGDNAQMIGLAEALGWPYEVKRIAYHRFELLPNLLFPVSLAGMDKRRSSPLAPPWPDLIIFAFRANENIARWIRRQSGGRSRYVLVGRPWSPHDEFDLIVTTPQLRQPARPNILHNRLPLHRVTPQRLAEAAAVLEPRLAHLPRPYISVLVGGGSGPYVFDRRAAARLGREASAMARRTGGSLLVTTSARTPRAAADALWDAIEDVPAHTYRWSPGDPDNPYFGFVAVADRHIVTGESISMITEACATGKPVYMLDFGGGPVPMRPPNPEQRPWFGRWSDFYLQTWIYALYMQL
ncbi:MAG TPA: ELM1/GtrOC1 family putative glycosyltransferase, partial [Thermoleophilaceae bacterium]|nr:ELM1/GtrOC1 family putative glycosyltransferase [Thermoleophilaceae bacterium]